jgi:uncharacterized membrane protein YfcA
VLVRIMGATSLVGAAVGGSDERDVRSPARGIVYVYLIVVGLWMLYESFAHVEHVLGWTSR